MSVTIKSKSDIQKLREAGRIAANALVHAGKVIHPGMTTKQLDKSIHDFIVGCGAVPTFLGYGGFPASACISINDEIIHGIPSHKRVIREGDIVSVDVVQLLTDSSATRHIHSPWATFRKKRQTCCV